MSRAPAVANRPNIVVVVCHDLGRHLGCYGVSTVDSPAIDRLAAEGVRFSNSFCVAPQCSPSRAAMFTGRYPHSNGVMGLTHADFAWDLHPDERHLAQLLGAAGYHTALAGLQHESRDTGRLGFAEIMENGLEPCAAVAARAASFLERAAHAAAPFYLQVGFIEPHRLFGWFQAPFWRLPARRATRGHSSPVSRG